MNSSTEFSLLLDELRKLHKLIEASRIEASRCVSVPTPAAVVATDVAADNWGGLFDGDDDSIEQHCATQPIVADNWGGLFAGGNDSDEQHYEALIVADNCGELFEQPAHEPEEHDLSLSAIDVFGSNQIRNGNNFTSTVEYVLLDASEELVLPLPCGSKSASLSSELESGLACPEQLHVDAAVTKYTCTDPDAPLEAGQKLTQSGPIDIALDAACASAPSSTTVSDDVLALVDLKSGLSDPASRLALWSEDADRVCAWQGKSCDPHTGRVAALDLPAASLARRLTRSALLRLGALVSLTLPGNRLFVTLPDTLPPHIRALDVSGNAISGGIRASFVSCESLNLLPTRCSMQVRNNNGRMEITTEANVTEVRAVFRAHTSTLRPMRPWPPPTELRLPSCDAGLRPLPWPSEQLTINWHSCLCSKPQWIVSASHNCSGILDQQPQMLEHMSDTSLEYSLEYQTGAVHPGWCTSDVCFVPRSNVRLVLEHETRESKSRQPSTPRILLWQFHTTQCHVVLICATDKEKVTSQLQHNPSIVALHPWRVSCSVIAIIHSTTFCLLHGILLVLMEAFIDLFLSWLADHMIILSNISRELILWSSHPPTLVELQSCSTLSEVAMYMSVMRNLQWAIVSMISYFIRLLENVSHSIRNNLAKAIDNHHLNQVIFLETDSADMTDSATEHFQHYDQPLCSW